MEQMKSKEFWLKKFNEYGTKFGEDPVEYFIPEKGFQNTYNFLIKNNFVSKEILDKAIAQEMKCYGEAFVKKNEDINGFLDIANSISEVTGEDPDEDEYCNWAAAFLASDYATKWDRECYLKTLSDNEDE